MKDEKQQKQPQPQRAIELNQQRNRQLTLPKTFFFSSFFFYYNKLSNINICISCVCMQIESKYTSIQAVAGMVGWGVVDLAHIYRQLNVCALASMGSERRGRSE
jgi:hypothetical protein